MPMKTLLQQKNVYWVLLGLSLFLAISGCRYGQSSWVDSGYYKKPESVDLIEKTNAATDELLDDCSIFLNQDKAIIVTSLVNIDDIQKSSTYGRMSGEIVASRMSQKKYNVKEVKFSQSNVFVRKHEGELALSRQIKEIAHNHDVQAIVVGTYAIGQEKVHVSLRLVRTEDSRIGCAHCYSLPHAGDSGVWSTDKTGVTNP